MSAESLCSPCQDQDDVLPARLSMIPTTVRMEEEALAATVTLCRPVNLDEKVPNVRGFITSTACCGVNLKTWLVYGDDEPALYPVTVMVQATAVETTPF